MTTEAASRAGEPTLADVLGAIAAAPTLTAPQRHDMASAVRTTCRMLGRTPEQTSAEPPRLARRLAEVSPAAFGISKGRWANVRSLLHKALTLTKPMMPGRHRAPLSAEWQALADRLDGGQAIRLSRLFHWLTDHGITPTGVTVGDLEAFGTALRDSTLAKKPEEAWRGTAWAWNKAQRAVGGWPAITVTVTKRRQPYTLPWSVFPPSLKADVDRYLDRLAGRDLLEDLPFRPARPETVAFREHQLRTFASALVHRGRDPATLRCIADLVEFETFKDGLRFFLERRGDKTSVSLHNFAGTLKAIARHHVKADAATLDRMHAVVKRLELPSHGLTRKNRDRLRPFDDPAMVQALIELPHRLMDRASRGKPNARAAALLAQMAVAIEILVMAPIRLKNLLDLEPDRSLVAAGTTLHLVFEPNEVKNGEVIDIPLPTESAELIKLYSERYLPLLAPAGNSMLFPGEGVGAKSRSTFRQQLGRAIFQYTGLRMNPHLFRHARAKIHLDRHPGEYAIVGTALGHRSIDTTREFYTGFENAAAMRRFDELILALRRRPKEQP